jgi:hypothetical protein
MTDEPLIFKHVRGGKPFAPSEIPKLPPAAMRAMLTYQRDHPEADPFQTAMDIAVDIVAIALRRIEPTLSVSIVYDDEDYEMVLRAYGHIQRANPAFFSPSDTRKLREVESPNAARPA